MKFFVVFSVVISIIVGMNLSQKISGQKAVDEHTTVRRGVATPEERAYSQTFRDLYGTIFLRTLPELAAASERRNEFVSRIHYEPPYSMGLAPESASEFIAKNTCNADAVVIAEPSKKAAHLTDDEKFIYTQYEITVKEIVKNDRRTAISKDAKLQVVRPGGLIRLNGQNIRFIDENVEQLVLGQMYLLFLRDVPNARGYVVADFDADFLLSGDSVTGVGKPGGLPNEVKQNRISRHQLINEINGVVTSGCKKTSGDNL